MGITVSINGADQRTDQALAKVTRDNQIVTLTASAICVSCCKKCWKNR